MMKVPGVAVYGSWRRGVLTVMEKSVREKGQTKLSLSTGQTNQWAGPFTPSAGHKKVFSLLRLLPSLLPPVTRTQHYSPPFHFVALEIVFSLNGLTKSSHSFFYSSPPPLPFPLLLLQPPASLNVAFSII